MDEELAQLNGEDVLQMKHFYLQPKLWIWWMYYCVIHQVHIKNGTVASCCMLRIDRYRSRATVEKSPFKNWARLGIWVAKQPLALYGVAVGSWCTWSLAYGCAATGDNWQWKRTRCPLQNQLTFLLRLTDMKYTLSVPRKGGPNKRVSSPHPDKDKEMNIGHIYRKRHTVKH